MKLTPTDDELRNLWRSKGGRFHGPNVETGTMPESMLLPWLRELVAGLESVAQEWERIHGFDKMGVGLWLRQQGAKPTPINSPADRCHLCDNTGDIHGIDGEWRGECPHCKPAEPSANTDGAAAQSQEPVAYRVVGKGSGNVTWWEGQDVTVAYPPEMYDITRYVAEAQEAIQYEPGKWTKVQSVDEMQRFFLSRLPAIREAAREHGYAIGTHGSQRRDFDLIAMQWRDGASDKDTLAHAIAMAACGITQDGPYQWEEKPAGRLAVSISMCWTKGNRLSEGMIDLSLFDTYPLADRPGEGEWPIDRDWLSAVLRHARKCPDYFPEVLDGNVALDEDDVDAIIAALNAAPTPPAAPNDAEVEACLHSWRDWTGTRNVVWCPKCDGLAFAGNEQTTICTGDRT